MTHQHTWSTWGNVIARVNGTMQIIHEARYCSGCNAKETRAVSK